MKKCSNVMTKQQYCEFVRTTDPEQREIILEVIHRLHGCGDDVCEALQIFFTGLVGCGETYTLKCLIETYNCYAQEQRPTLPVPAQVKPLYPWWHYCAFSVSSYNFSQDKILIHGEFASLQKHVRWRFVDKISTLISAILKKSTTDCSRLPAFTTNHSETST